MWNKKYINKVIISCMAVLLISNTAYAKEFEDVKMHWANEYITELSDKGVISGMDDGLFHPDESVTTEQFIAMIIRNCKGEINAYNEEWSSGYINYALMQGIIEDYDVINRTEPIERRSAARIVHEVLLKEYHENDESEWLGADKLSDLYDCHSCVNHIAQVYTKGIMTGRTDTFFDNYGTLTRAEAASVIIRLDNKDKRTVPQIKEQSTVTELTPEEAFELIKNNADTILVDVRSKDLYAAGHIESSINITVDKIKKNPYITADKSTPIILYCVKGYNSKLAAEQLIAAGYSSVYVIPGIEQYEYELVK